LISELELTFLEFLVKSSGKAYEKLNILTNVYMKKIDSLLEFMSKVDLLLICMSVITGFTMVWTTLVMVMARAIKVNKDMESLIPTSMIMQNEPMMLHIFGKKRLIQKQRRMEKNRRRKKYLG
jgi:hypothetical protein